MPKRYLRRPDGTLAEYSGGSGGGISREEFDELSEAIEELQKGSGTVVSAVEPADDDIPKVFIDGEIPTSKTEVLAELEYVSKTESFHAYLEIKCQGDSSMGYPKKNFTIKMFSDEARETKLKKEFRGWGKHNKYVLKANYIDHTHARNIVGSKLWGQIVGSRSDYNSLPDGLKYSPNNGAIEGFPIKVYNNGTYQGIYTWNIPKDDWLYGVDEDNANQFVLYGQHNTNGVYAKTANNFRALWNGVSQSNGQWEVEVGTNSDIVKTALNNVISLCMNADDATFKSTLNSYLDVQSALDYYIFCYTICALDSLAQNMILVSYDGTKLYCSAYDLDSTFGLWWNGSKFVSPSYRCPEDYQERYSLLWERIESLYVEELKSRYAELRASVLSFANMVTHFERFMDVIDSDLYAEDVTIYTGIPSASTNNITQIRNYIRYRLEYVDGEIDALGTEIPEPDEPSENPCTGITLDKTELIIDGKGTQVITATVTPVDTTDAVVWTSSAPTVASIVTEDNICTVQGVADGSATITVRCGKYNASCSVSVSNLTINILKDVGWENGYINDNTGELVTGGKNDISSGMFAVDTFAGQNVVLNIYTHDTAGTNKIAYYDENQSYLNNVKLYGGKFTIPAECKYARFSILKATTNGKDVLKLYAPVDNLFDYDAVIVGTPDDPTDTGTKHYKLAVSPGDSYLVYGGWRVDYISTDGSVMKKFTGDSTIIDVYTIPDGVSWLALSATVIDVTQAKPGIASEWTEIGSSELLK